MQGRQLEILRAIVEEYISTEEPIGSKVLAARSNLDVSPATIRNEMAVLEEAGFITAPHTSSGRIPTDKGYRLFVDKLADVKPLSQAERRAIETFLDGATTVDDVVTRTVRLLAQVTKQVAVVQYPSMSRSKVRHIELVNIQPSRLMMILITDNARVEQRTIELPFDVSEGFLSSLHIALNKSLQGSTLASVTERIEGLSHSFSGNERTAIQIVTTILAEMAVERAEEKVVLAGTANLALHSHEFSSSIHPILEALEEQVVLLRLLSDAGGDVTVKIGEEQSEKSLKQTSLVTMKYGVDGEAPAGALGILGPRRMDYASSMGAVSSVARYIGHFLSEAE
jgi:heat-inducible transcriptional repressor